MVFRGEQRWAEFSPFVEYDTQESATWLEAALSFANEDLPDLKREWIDVNATLPAVAAWELTSVLENFPGFRTVKIKVAQSGQVISDDLDRVRAVRNAYPNAKIRLDANGGFSVTQALELIASLSDIELEYFEQPVATIAELKQLRAELKATGSPLKIAADESIRKASDPLLVAREGAADIAVLKMQPLGGITKAVEIAQQTGLDVVVSSALESSLGIAQGLFLAAAIPELPYDNGLWTQNLLAGDIVKEPLSVRDARIEVKEPELAPDLLEKYQASPESQKFWMQRFQDCLDYLES